MAGGAADGAAEGLSTAEVLRGVGRALAGAVLFALPIFMTMEVWSLAVSVTRVRLVLLVLAGVLLSIGLAHYFGFVNKERIGALDAVIDAGVAMLAGLVAAAAVLCLLAVVEPWQGWRTALSVVALEALPAAIGASFARSQLGADRRRAYKHHAQWREGFLMAAGAVVVAANIAPTEEVVLIAARMSPVHGAVLIAFELALMHAFVYGLRFRSGTSLQGGTWKVLLTWTVIAHVIALGVSAYLLWTFGRFDGTGLSQVVMETVVLALPAGLGAAAARLVV
ncbi:TIGR02587 family membrane protein [Kineococcus esterisolvens]|uniref:TIGR02587 family membrane protein n=1 Tax=unclassified Kineococcus TaxID=2621656 RepID=UPI003D7D094F